MTSALKVFGPMSLAVDALAVHRLTRLVTRDTITRPLRARVIRWSYTAHPMPWRASQPVAMSESEWDEMPHNDDDAPKLAAFIVCPWCVGLWISLGITAARRYTPWAWQPVARVLALSTAAALIAGHEVEA